MSLSLSPSLSLSRTLFLPTFQLLSIFRCLFLERGLSFSFSQSASLKPNNSLIFLPSSFCILSLIFLPSSLCISLIFLPSSFCISLIFLPSSFCISLFFLPSSFCLSLPPFVHCPQSHGTCFNTHHLYSLSVSLSFCLSPWLPYSTFLYLDPPERESERANDYSDQLFKPQTMEQIKDHQRHVAYLPTMVSSDRKKKY